MASIDQLKTSIMSVIQNDNFDLKTLETILTPLPLYTSNQLFMENIGEIVSIVTQNRDGNDKFDVNDLKLLSQDVGAITSLITAILLVIGCIPDLKLQYAADATEELVFKVLAYVFLVIVPEKTGSNWSLDDKSKIVDITLAIYELIKSSQMVKDLLAKVVAWLKSKIFCACAHKQVQRELVLQDKLPKLKTNLLHSMNNVRDKSDLQSRINALEAKLEAK